MLLIGVIKRHMRPIEFDQIENLVRRMMYW